MDSSSPITSPITSPSTSPSTSFATPDQSTASPSVRRLRLSSQKKYCATPSTPATSQQSDEDFVPSPKKQRLTRRNVFAPTSASTLSMINIREVTETKTLNLICFEQVEQLMTIEKSVYTTAELMTRYNDLLCNLVQNVSNDEVITWYTEKKSFLKDIVKYIPSIHIVKNMYIYLSIGLETMLAKTVKEKNLVYAIIEPSTMIDLKAVRQDIISREVSGAFSGTFSLDGILQNAAPKSLQHLVHYLLYGTIQYGDEDFSLEVLSLANLLLFNHIKRDRSDKV